MNSLAPRGSLRIRLLAGTLFWIAASIVVAGWGLRDLFQRHVEAQFHAELTTHLDQLAAQLTVDEQGRPALAQALSDPRLSRPYSGCYWQIDRIDENGGSDPAARGLLRSRSLWDHVLSVPPDAPADGEIHRHRVAGPEDVMLGMVERSVRIEETPNGKPKTFRLIAAADESQMAGPVARFSGTLWLALGILGAGLVLAALVQVFVGLAPLRKLRIALGQVRSGGTQRLEGEFPLEIMPLVEEFNSVLAQNAEVVERARTQAGNLAHALKTPLSVLANAAGATTRKDDELARLVVDQVGTARRQVDYHLARAQVAAATRLPGVRTALTPVIDGLVNAMRHIHAGRQLDFQVQSAADSLQFRGEIQDLQEMLGNLLDNACKWASSRVRVAALETDAQLRIDIDDDGPGIAARDRPLLLQRGMRGDERVPGSGLGLSIVNDLAGLYGGRLELQEAPAGGLRARLWLPAGGKTKSAD